MLDRPMAVIIGAGEGLSAALARELAVDHDLVLAARNGARMRAAAEETGARTVLLEATDETAVAHLFDELPARRGSWSTTRPPGCADRWRSFRPKRCAARSR
jgi:NAD(P)-dependent dehydrogenase (short-subunit alcohol dehydrogenase family)